MRIEARYNGPADSANGGIAAGMLADHLADPVVQVTLRRPPPLETHMTVTDGRLLDGTELVADAVPGTVDLTVPEAVTVQDAARAAAGYAGLIDHPFPTCFVCGPARSDGLGLTAGPLTQGGVGCVWTPAESTSVMTWAALDCPGGWSADVPGRPMVLGRMTTRIDALPTVGEPHVVQGWLLGGEGRKVHTGSALFTAAGEVLAVAQATWITLT